MGARPTKGDDMNNGAGEGWDYLYGAAIIVMIVVVLVALGYFTSG